MSEAAGKDGYELLDSGDGRKLERFGSVCLDRPCSQAAWSPSNPGPWKKADAVFERSDGQKWHNRQALPGQWNIQLDGTVFKLSATDFGHLGLFPEQRPLWNWIRETCAHQNQARKAPVNILNLFAYSGGATLAAARGGAKVCHLDASKGMVAWARENAALNKLDEAPIRWIVDDVTKFLKREQRRGNKYDGIILDPPTFGRGKLGEVFKIEREITGLLDLCFDLLASRPVLFLLSSHTPGYTPIVLQNLLKARFEKESGQFDAGEMILEGGSGVLPVPSGAYARWNRNA